MDLTPDKMREIEAIGIKVINLEEVIGDKLYTREYQLSETDTHPNAKAWECVASELVKKKYID